MNELRVLKQLERRRRTKIERHGQAMDNIRFQAMQRKQMDHAIMRVERNRLRGALAGLGPSHNTAFVKAKADLLEQYLSR